MAHFGKLFLSIAFLTLANCARLGPSPNLLDCYQSGNLKLRLKKDRIFISEEVSGRFSVNKRKIGWVISTNFILVKNNLNVYEFEAVDDGPYDWSIPNASVNMVKIVSQDGVPFYFGKCLGSFSRKSQK